MVLSEIDKRAEKEREVADLLSKFRKTSLRRLQALQDKPQKDDDILGGEQVVVAVVVG